MLPKPSSYALYVQDSNLFLPPPKIIFRKWFKRFTSESNFSVVSPSGCLHGQFSVVSRATAFHRCSPLCRMVEQVFASQWGGMSAYGCPLELSPVADSQTNGDSLWSAASYSAMPITKFQIILSDQSKANSCWVLSALMIQNDFSKIKL